MQKSRNLTLLGASKTKYPTSPNEAKLETFDNKSPGSLYLVPFICTEFTSLCPKTGQPDFARFEIVYVPRVKMIESKSLKLYLFSFRNHGSFHEEVTNRIFNDLWIILQPYYLRVFGDFTVRGGIAIKPLVERCASCSSLNQQRIRSLIDAWDRMKHQCREI